MDSKPPLIWQEAWETARRKARTLAMQLTEPRDEDGAWRAISFDSGQPEKKFDLRLDSYSGQTLFTAWDRQTAFAKATAIGIPFHRGEFGL